MTPLTDEPAYLGCVETVKQLKREGRLEEAAELLRVAVSQVEAECTAYGPTWKAAPWYSEQLAIVFRKLKRPDLSDAVIARYNALPGAVKMLRAPQGRAKRAQG